MPRVAARVLSCVTVVGGVVGTVLAALVTLWAGPAHAVDVPRQYARLERVEVEPYLANLTRVKVFLNLMHMEGSFIDGVKPEELVLVAGDTRLRAIPGVARFDSTDQLLDLAVVVELTPTFTSALEDLEEPVEKLIGRLPKNTTRVSVVGYGTEIKVNPLEEPSRAARRWRRLAPDDVVDKPRLHEALQKTIRMLANATPLRPSSSVRRVIVVISDGNDLGVQGADTMDDFRKVSKQAIDAGVTIHSIGFSLADDRIVLKNLGEISKKTQGTFRWAQTRADLGPFIESLTAELRKQMVLTYLVPAEQAIAAGTQLSVICRSSHCEGTSVGTLESNKRRAPKTLCAGSVCDVSQSCVALKCVTVRMTGARGGSAAIVAVLIGVLTAGGMAVVYVKKVKPRGKKKKGKRGEVEAPGAMPPPIIQPQIVLPDFSNMPYVANSAAAQQMQQQLANLPYVGAAMAQQAAAAQAAQAAQQRAAAPAPGARVSSIMVLSGPLSGQTFPLRHGFTVGKVRGCDLIIDDGFTSNHHAQFHIDLGGGCTVVDLGSTNGLYVNGVRATSQRLSHGMSVRVGQTELRFLAG